jgi:hypothetical protein
MKISKSRRKIREILLLVIVASLALWGCAPGAPTAALDEDAPAFIDPLPSPTPTWAAPDPDDEDPIVDCALDAPLCVIDVSLVDLAGEAYLGVELQVVPIPGRWQPEGVDNVLLDVNVSMQRDGETVAEINVEGHSVAVVPAEGSIILTQEDGAPLLSIASSELGVLMAVPSPSPSLAAAYDPSTQELLLLDAEGNPIATISAGGLGVLLADPRPAPTYHVSSDPTVGGFLILNEEEEPLVLVDASNATVWFLEPSGDRVVGLIMLNGLVVIAAPGVGPVGLISPSYYPAADADHGGRSLRITMLIPLEGVSDGTYDLAGTISLFGETSTGERVEFGTSSVDLKDPEKSPAPSPTPTASGGKATATFSAPKLTATPAAPKPDATTAPPKPTAKPTDDGGKPSPTPGK